MDQAQPRMRIAAEREGDVLVLTPFPLVPGSVVPCRAIGVLNMEDESGQDAKVLAVPVDKLTRMYRNVISHRDLPEILLDQISHFFAHYKDLEPGKFVKIRGWLDAEEAKREILEGVQRYDEAHEKPAY